MKTILTRNKLAAAILMALSLLALALGVLLFGAPAAAQASGGAAFRHCQRNGIVLLW